MNARLALLAALALGTSIAPPAHADTLLIDRVHRENTQSMPTRGMLMSAVAAQYGEPASKSGPVGGDSKQQPPITTWHYPNFNVYFENDHVVSSVAVRSTAQELGPKPAQ
jgi:hypothetical protein